MAEMNDMLEMAEQEEVAAIVDNGEQLDNPTRYKFVTGEAGTGKTYTMQRAVEAKPKYGVLCATTGIAAVNLGDGATTLHSLLKFRDVEDLADKFISGRLQARINQLANSYDNIIVDEISMLGATPFKIIIDAVKKVNDYKEREDKPIGLILTGDFCQLPPVKDKYVFNTRQWKENFAPNVERLTKVWRQTDPQFLAALNFARRGQGVEAAEALKKTAATWTRASDLKYAGTTIYGKNEKVDNFNKFALDRVLGREETYRSARASCTRPPSEWSKIPEVFDLKVGAYAMILANSLPNFEYVNGDCGTILEMDRRGVWIQLKRGNKEVFVPYLTRAQAQREEPAAYEFSNEVPRPNADRLTDDEDHTFPFFDDEKQRWIMGEINYLPVRLAYASTVHKTQGLSLDAIQVDIREAFMGDPNMIYVALSRVKTPEGLRLVGTPELLAKRCKIAEEVREWL